MMGGGVAMIAAVASRWKFEWREINISWSRFSRSRCPTGNYTKHDSRSGRLLLLLALEIARNEAAISTI
jgi:hypothetical protein